MRKRISQDVAAKAINKASLMNERVISSGKSDSYYIGYYKGVSKVIDASMGLGGRNPWNKRGYPACPIKTPMGLMAARASLLSLCVKREFPITMEDVDIISNSLNFVQRFRECFILVDSLESSSLASRLGVYAAFSEDISKQEGIDDYTQTVFIRSYTLRKYGRMTAKVSEAAPKKSKQEKISEAKAATLKYYADTAREAQKNYMRMFNALTEQ